MNIYLEALGCRLNAAEIETLSRQLAGGGAALVTAPEQAQVIVVNTCAVTLQATRKSRRRIHTLHHANPTAEIAVVGCWATEQTEAIYKEEGVRWVIPNLDKAQAAEIITGHMSAPAAWEPRTWGHTRPFLAVQDGCDHHCTYCITTILRGGARSRPLAEVMRDVHHLVAHGAQEIILTGVSLGAYGHDFGLRDGLGTLVQTILQDSDVPRLRLSSIEPWDVDDLLVQQWSDPRLCRQLHMPLQSGSDVVLRRMGRGMSGGEYKALVSRVRAISPDLALTTDVIVGFPGESDMQFQQSLDFVEELAFARLHVFPYSERDGTAAIKLPDAVPDAVRHERARSMRAMGQYLARTYRDRFIGSVMEVLFLLPRDGLWQGISDNYLNVTLDSDLDLRNQLCKVRLVDADDRGRLRATLRR